MRLWQTRSDRQLRREMFKGGTNNRVPEKKKEKKRRVAAQLPPDRFQPWRNNLMSSPPLRSRTRMLPDLTWSKDPEIRGANAGAIWMRVSKALEKQGIKSQFRKTKEKSVYCFDLKILRLQSLKVDRVQFRLPTPWFYFLGSCFGLCMNHSWMEQNQIKSNQIKSNRLVIYYVLR
jgi:hypothetical protein